MYATHRAVSARMLSPTRGLSPAVVVYLPVDTQLDWDATTQALLRALHDKLPQCRPELGLAEPSRANVVDVGAVGAVSPQAAWARLLLRLRE